MYPDISVILHVEKIKMCASSIKFTSIQINKNARSGLAIRRPVSNGWVHFESSLDFHAYTHCRHTHRAVLASHHLRKKKGIKHTVSSTILSFNKKTKIDLSACIHTQHVGQHTGTRLHVCPSVRHARCAVGYGLPLQ